MINKKLPLVSICIPTYNGEQHIQETLDSAINQTYTNIEIIICDDCSKDNTLTICNKNALLDSRIKVYKNSENLGLVRNWIEVMNKASSKWIKFLFQDDLLVTNCVEKMISAAITFNVDFVICNRTYFYDNNVSSKLKGFYDNLEKSDDIFPANQIISPEVSAKCIAPNYFNNCIGEPPALLFNKQDISKDDFPLKYRQLIDYIFALNQIMTKDFVFLKDSLLKFRIHSSSESMKNSDNENLEDKKLANYIYIQYYEKLLLCNELVANDKFEKIAALIPKKIVKYVQIWTILKSYKKLGFKRVHSFYEQSSLSLQILNTTTNSYTYFKYKFYKLIGKSIRKKYRV